jgi:hypothetical protein
MPSKPLAKPRAKTKATDMQDDSQQEKKLRKAARQLKLKRHCMIMMRGFSRGKGEASGACSSRATAYLVFFPSIFHSFLPVS